MTSKKPVEILLIEDNPDDAEVTLRALNKRNLGNRIEWIKDGAEALHFLFGDGVPPADTDVPRVILLDLRLPKVDGLEVLAKIKADGRTKHIPVVILTSSTQDADVEKAYALGANSFVSKPVRFEEFADTVEKLGMYWLLVNKPLVKG
jgi:CheY-like chemotaxis protein